MRSHSFLIIDTLVKDNTLQKEIAKPQNRHAISRVYYAYVEMCSLHYYSRVSYRRQRGDDRPSLFTERLGSHSTHLMNKILVLMHYDKNVQLRAR